MSTLEATISMLEALPEEARRKVFEYTQKLFVSPKPSSPYEPVGAERLFADLEESRQQFAQGMGRDAKEALDEMGRKHGFV